MELPDKLYAPIGENQKIGKLIVVENGKTIGQVDLIVSHEIKKASIFEIFKRTLSQWLNF